MTRVSVRPEVLKWACERAGHDLEYVVERFPKYQSWVQQELQPTIKQLEKFANFTHVPLGYLFLSEPPEERLPIPDFRTVSDETRTQVSPDLLDTLYLMLRRQNWLSDYLRDVGEQPLSFVSSKNLSDEPNDVAEEIRATLALEGGWAAKNYKWREAVSELRNAIEKLGVMAVINGVVGNNTHRKLRVEEFRGFAVTDSYAPLIFVNGADAKSAQLFTLAHELAHIWLGRTALTGYEQLLLRGREEELWCNQVAAEMLVPARYLRNAWKSLSDTNDEFKRLAREFKVSPIVIARRALDLNFIDQRQFLDFYEPYSQQESQRSSGTGRGDFYANQGTRIGGLFAVHVFHAALEGRLGFKKAYELTGLNGGTFQKFARTYDINLPV